jgi:dipeptide/tripeptide permease
VASAVTLVAGSVVTAVLIEEDIVVVVDATPQRISMLWQVPQTMVITAGEVMFSVTGLEFAYSQSPERYAAAPVVTAALMQIPSG